MLKLITFPMVLQSLVVGLISAVGTLGIHALGCSPASRQATVKAIDTVTQACEMVDGVLDAVNKTAGQVCATEEVLGPIVRGWFSKADPNVPCVQITGFIDGDGHTGTVCATRAQLAPHVQGYWARHNIQDAGAQ
jgi:hypothetical protein